MKTQQTQIKDNKTPESDNERDWKMQARNAITQGQTLNSFILNCYPGNRIEARKAYLAVKKETNPVTKEGRPTFGFNVHFDNDETQPAAPAQAQHSPLASFERLVKATNGQETGCYELRVGDLMLRSNEWDKQTAEKWLPIVIRACNNAQRLSDELERCRDLLIGYKTAFPNHFADLDARFGADAVIKSAYQALQDFEVPNAQKGGQQ